MTPRLASADHTHPVWEAMMTRVDTDGCATHPMVRRLCANGVALRDVADALHTLGAVYGGPPGLADEVLAHLTQPAAAPWLTRVTIACADERAYLAALVSAVGPMPSTPAQAETEAALVGQRHALHMLAGSARVGCATGAVIAHILDWTTIRPVLDHAAQRLGLTPPAMAFPPRAETAALVAMLTHAPGSDRAMGFGAGQLLAQHRGLWDLIDARASARDRT